MALKLFSLLVVLLVKINNSYTALPGLLHNLKQSEFIAEFLNKHHSAIVESIILKIESIQIGILPLF